MKFGHTLRTSLNPEWTFHYVGKKKRKKNFFICLYLNMKLTKKDLTLYY